MRVSERVSLAPVPQCAVVLAGLLLLTAGPLASEQPGTPPGPVTEAAPAGASQGGGKSSAPASPCEPASLGSPFIPVDSWVYPAIFRLYSLGFVDDVFLGMRPWTRASVSHMLE